jgi:hypothetical protein
VAAEPCNCCLLHSYIESLQQSAPRESCFLRSYCMCADWQSWLLISCPLCLFYRCCSYIHRDMAAPVFHANTGAFKGWVMDQPQQSWDVCARVSQLFHTTTRQSGPGLMAHLSSISFIAPCLSLCVSSVRHSAFPGISNSPHSYSAAVAVAAGECRQRMTCSFWRWWCWN